MNKTWYCYIMLSVGLMLLAASDKALTADDKQTAHEISFGSEQKIEIMINKDGEEDAQVKLIIDGKDYNFSMLDVVEDGEDQVITTDDGKTITIKSISGNKMIFVDGNQLHLPSLSNHQVTREGLSAMIGRSQHLKMNNDVSLVADGLSDDVKAAMIEAVEGVLSSYNVDKKVTFRDNNVSIRVINMDDDQNGLERLKLKIEGDHKKIMKFITIDQVVKKEVEEN